MIAFNSFLAGDTMSIPMTPTTINKINKVVLQYGQYDDLFVTGNVTDEIGVNYKPRWDFDTVMYAKFNGNASAGNLPVKLSEISHLIIKRRKQGDSQWITIKAVEVFSVDDMNFMDVDYTAQNFTTYDYAAVTVLNGVEGVYSVTTADCEFDALVIADENEIYATILTNMFCDTTSVVPNQVVETMYGTYPTIVRNTDMNYETVSVTATFIPNDECDIDMSDKARTEFAKRVMTFLRNGRPKILKNADSRMWLIYVTTPPTDTAVDVYNIREITFEGTEIGSCTKEEDLYDAGLISAGEEWWST